MQTTHTTTGERNSKLAGINVVKAFDVPPHCFHPRPKVWSSMVVMTPRPVAVEGSQLPAYRRVAKAVFAGRRKTVRNGLKPIMDDVDAVLRAAGVDPGVRAETLDIDVFGRLAIAAHAAGLKGDVTPEELAEADAETGEDGDAGAA